MPFIHMVKKNPMEKVWKVEAPEKELGGSHSEQANQISSLAVEPVGDLYLSPLSPHRTPVGLLIFRLIPKESDGMNLKMDLYNFPKSQISSWLDNLLPRPNSVLFI